MDGPAVLSCTPGRVRVRWASSGNGSLAPTALGAVLQDEPGVRQVDAYPRTRSLVVRFDPRQTSAEALLRRLGQLAVEGNGRAGGGRTRSNGAVAMAPTPRAASGPPAEVRNHGDGSLTEVHNHGDGSLTGSTFRLALGGAVLVVLTVRRVLLRAAPALPPRFAVIGGVLGLITGYPFFKGMARTLAGRQRLDTDTLVGVATIVSIIMSESVVAIVVLWLLTLGELLQAVVLRRTRRAIRDLLVDRGDAWVIVNGTEVRTPVDQLQVGDVVAVYRGDRLPADGELIEGEGAVDEAPITGESIPNYKRPGDAVWAGTIVATGALRFRVERVGSQTVVGRLIQRVEAAEELRAPIQTLGEQFARRFVPASFALAALVFLVTRDARRAMTMLLVACPCAAGLSTPTAVSASIANGARRGMLIKGGAHLESAGQIDTVVFDKTGTLTAGQPRVSTVYSLHDDVPPEEVLVLAASGEFHSKHPLAIAVVKHAEERALEIPEHEECEILVGQGVRADMRGNRILVGSERLLAQFHLAVPDRAKRLAVRLSRGGETPLYVAYNDRALGVLGIADQLRPEAAEALAAVRAEGIGRLILLSGDIPTVARAVGRRLGFAPSDIYARALPEDKYALVRELQAKGHRVAMVGDGINDAPALAAADLGIAMGTAGSDVAIEAADVALAGNDIRQVAGVIRLGRHTLGVIRQNYGLAIGVNSLGIVAGAAGTLNPFAAAVLHNLSSLAVLLNSARLVRYRESAAPRPPRAGAPEETSRRRAPRRLPRA